MKRSTVTKVVGIILGQKHLEDQEAVKKQAHGARLQLERRAGYAKRTTSKSD